MSSAFKLYRIVEFINDPKLLAKGENHVESGNVYKCNFVLGVLTGSVYSSMKNKMNHVEVIFTDYEKNILNFGFIQSIF